MIKRQVPVGERYGRLVVVEAMPPGIHRHTQWLCQCDCGQTKIVRQEAMLSGRVQSCGCLTHVATQNAIKKCTTHGESRTRLHRIWAGMLQRCENPNRPGYKRYGARGITVCSEWHDYITFRNWAIANEYTDLLTLERNDNDGNYCPENCRWATVKEQANNTRRNRTFILNGTERKLQDLALEYNISASTIWQRVCKLGWTVEEAVAVPPRKREA